MLHSRTQKLGVSLALVIVLLAAMALWTWNAGGVLGGASDTVGYKGFVEWKVFGPDGVLKASGANHNAVNTNPVLDDIVNSLLAGATITAGNAIVAQSATTAAGSTIAAADVRTDVHGKAGSTAEACPGTSTSRTNPVAGTNAAASSGGAGTRSVTATFTACASASIAQLSLVKASAEDTDTTKADITNANRLALQGVTITLASGDTLQVTWTLTATQGA